jgi:putative RecB family exonuclease
VRPVYSHSRLSCFEQCPQRFRYRYLDQVPVETESIEAFLGKRVHEVLERLNRFVGLGRVPSLSRVIERFRTEWASAFDGERVRIVRDGIPPEAYRENGERCLANHYRRHYPFDREETLGIEEPVSFSLDEAGSYRMRGVVDRIARAPDGAIEIHDYKTGRWVPSQKELDEDRQLALYQIGAARRFRGRGEVRLVWHYLQRNQVRVSTRTPEQLSELRENTILLIDRIEGEERFEPRPSPLCAWCEYQPICPASAGGCAAGARSEPQASGVHKDAPDSATTPPSGARSEPQASEVPETAASAALEARGSPLRPAGARSEPQASGVHKDAPDPATTPPSGARSEPRSSCSAREDQLALFRPA